MEMSNVQYVDDIERKIKYKIALSKMYEEECKKQLPHNKISVRIVKIAACLLLVLMTGVAFAKEIKTIVNTLFNNTSESINVAVENGYVQETRDNYTFDKNIGIKVNSIVFDGINLDISYDFNVNSENIDDIQLKTYSIKTDKEQLLYGSETTYAERIEDVALVKSLSNTNKPIKINTNTIRNSIMYVLRENSDFDELKFDINKICIHNGNEYEIIEGNWSFNVSIDGKMKGNSIRELKLDSQYDFIDACKGTISNTALIIRITFKTSEKFDEIMTSEDAQKLFVINTNDNKYYPDLIELPDEKTVVLTYNSLGLFNANDGPIELYIKVYDSTIELK